MMDANEYLLVIEEG